MMYRYFASYTFTVNNNGENGFGNVIFTALQKISSEKDLERSCKTIELGLMKKHRLKQKVEVIILNFQLLAEVQDESPRR